MFTSLFGFVSFPATQNRQKTIIKPDYQSIARGIFLKKP